MERDRRREIERRLGYRFLDALLLEDALTHSSAKTDKRTCNERLEFLGDAILGLVISEFLYTAFPDRDEGELTRIKSVVVSAPALSHEAKRLGLEQVVDVGRGVQKDGIPSSILANVFEAVTGAIYLDGGLEPARRFILNNLADPIEGVVRARHSLNWKSLLQQLTQRLWAETPTYEVARELGPEHGKEFEVVALVKGEVKGAGRGRSKKLAEQSAARAALESLLGAAASTLDARRSREAGRGGRGAAASEPQGQSASPSSSSSPVPSAAGSSIGTTAERALRGGVVSFARDPRRVRRRGPRRARAAGSTRATEGLPGPRAARARSRRSRSPSSARPRSSSSARRRRTSAPGRATSARSRASRAPSSKNPPLDMSEEDDVSVFDAFAALGERLRVLRALSVLAGKRASGEKGSRAVVTSVAGLLEHVPSPASVAAPRSRSRKG